MAEAGADQGVPGLSVGVPDCRLRKYWKKDGECKNEDGTAADPSCCSVVCPNKDTTEERTYKMQKGKCVTIANGDMTFPTCCENTIQDRPCGLSPKRNTEGKCYDEDYANSVDDVCCYKMELSARVVVMGKLGDGSEDDEPSYNKNMAKAQMGIMKTLIQVMFDDAHFPKSSPTSAMPRKDFKLSEQKSYNVKKSVLDKEAFNQVGQYDRRSMKERTVFFMKLQLPAGGWGTVLANRLCNSHTSRQELPQAVIRNLEVAKLYPYEGLKGVFDGSDPTIHVGSVVLLQSQVTYTMDDGTVLQEVPAECRSMEGNSASQFFQAPVCPAEKLDENLMKKLGLSKQRSLASCDRIELVDCTPEENARKDDYYCKCPYGYDGGLSLSKNDRGQFNKEYSKVVFEGTEADKSEIVCARKEKFCPVDEFETEMRHLDGTEDITGKLGEKIEAKCDLGFMQTAPAAVCDSYTVPYKKEVDGQTVESTKEQGYWTTSPTCAYVAASAPPNPQCASEPFQPGRKNDHTACSCNAEYLTTKGDCKCKVSCEEGFIPVNSQDKEGSFPAICEVAQHSCPEDVKGVFHDDGKKECFAGDKQLFGLDAFCCKDYWKTTKETVVEDSLKDNQKCEEILSIADCYKAQNGPSVGGHHAAPCCWNDQGWQKKGSKEDSTRKGKCMAMGVEDYTDTLSSKDNQCAVRFEVVHGQWGKPGAKTVEEGALLQCAKKCGKPNAPHVKVDRVCECYPGQAIGVNECNCRVECEEGYEKIGGGAVGDITCDLETKEFLMPVCRLPQKEDTPLCEAPTDTKQRPDLDPNYLALCVGKKAGEESCKLPCRDGYGLQLQHKDTDMSLKCERKEKKLTAFSSCSTIQKESDCLNAMEGGNPCCWRSDKNGEGWLSGSENFHCLAMGHVLIGSNNKWPTGYVNPGDSNSIITGCAKKEQGLFEKELPQCFPVCKNIFRGVEEYKFTGCDDCAAGDADCKCEVECNSEKNYVKYGGLKLSNRLCKEHTLESGEKIGMFDAGPVCKIPGAGERVDPTKPGGGGGGEDDEKDLSNSAAVACRKLTDQFKGKMENAVASSGCHDSCIASVDGADSDKCGCKVTCNEDARNTDTEYKEEVNRKCNLLPRTDLTALEVCTAHTSKDKCTSAVDKEAKTPCCWKESGLTKDGHKCQARGAEDMIDAPDTCTVEYKGEWDAHPTCEKKIVIDDLNQDPSSGLEGAGCSKDCVVGKPCECEFTCPAEKPVHLGGGKTGKVERTWKLESDGSVSLSLDQAAPICKTAWVAKCSAADREKTGFKIEETSEGDCVAGKCKVKESCEALWGVTDGEETIENTCELREVDVGKCDAASGKDECLKRSEDGVPCCYRKDGFEGGGKCQKRGDWRISSDKLPDRCSDEFIGEWRGPEKAPPASPKCREFCKNNIGDFKGKNKLTFTDEGACDKCFADEAGVPEEKKCKCEANCADETNQWWPTAPGSAPWTLSCGSSAGMGFVNPPVCVKVGESASRRLCATPSVEGAKIVTGCDDCANNGDACECEMGCEDRFEKVAGDKNPVCKRGAWDCPGPEGQPKNAEQTSDNKCMDTKKKKPTFLVCCIDKSKPLYETLKDTGFTADWHNLIKCERKCEPYNPTALANINAKENGKCADCLGSKPGECECKVGCDGGMVHYGGAGLDVQRKCITGATPVLDPQTLPVCGPKFLPEEDTCIVKTRNTKNKEGTAIGKALNNYPGSDPEDCDDCKLTMKDGELSASECKCKLKAGNDWTFVINKKVSEEKPVECIKVPRQRELVSSCKRARSCLDSEESPEKPCCKVKGKCIAKGDPEMKDVPEQCARDWEAVFEMVEEPVRKCNTRSLEGDGVVFDKQICGNCYAGQKDCKCKLSCETDLEWKGGGKLGLRPCDDLANYGEAPICGKRDEIATCSADSSSVGDDKIELPRRCSGKKQGESCKFTCKSAFADKRKESERPDATCDKVETGKGSECSSRSKDDCTTLLDPEGKPCCFQAYSSIWRSGGRCESMGSDKLDPTDKMPVCGTKESPTWTNLPQCVKAALPPGTKPGGGGKNPGDDDDDDNDKDDEDTGHGPRIIDIDDEWQEGCSACAPGVECSSCKINCKAGLIWFGGVPETKSGYTVKPTKDGVIELPLCAQPPPPARCDEPKTADHKDFVTNKGLAPWASVKLPQRCAGCKAGEMSCCFAVCADGYVDETGRADTVSVPCEEIKGFTLTKKKCSDLSETECLQAQDSETETDTPCCWSGNRCMPRGDKSMKRLPALDPVRGRKCALPTAAKFDEKSMPKCRPQCKSDFLPQGMDSSEWSKTCSNCDVEELEAQSAIKTFSSAEGGAAGWSIKEGAKFQKGVDAGEWVQVKSATPGESLNGWVKWEDIKAHTKNTKTCQCKAMCAKGWSANDAGAAAAGDRTCRLDMTTNKAVLDQDFPECRKICEKPDDALGTVDVIGDQCDDCVGGAKSCNCELRCADGSQYVGGGGEGPITCGINGEWTSKPPQCSPRCEPPSDQGGTLSVRRCLKSCAPGEKCECKLECAYGYRASAGQPGSFKCFFEPGHYDMSDPQNRRMMPARAKWGSSEVRGGCKWRTNSKKADNDQTAHGDRYGRWCSEVNEPTCNSELAGAYYFMDDKASAYGGIAETSRGCTGSFEFKRSTYTQQRVCTCNQDPAMLVCMPTFVLEVVNAKTNEPLIGATVEIFESRGRNGLVAHDTVRGPTTRFNGVDLMVMYIEVSADGFVKALKLADRKVDCANQGSSECQFKISVLPVPAGGVVLDVADGECHLRAPTPNTVRFNAVLEWNTQIPDLDIWVRSFDCGIDTQMRYNCGMGKSLEATLYRNGRPECRRSDFYDGILREGSKYKDTVRGFEEQMCRVSNANAKADGRYANSKDWFNEFPKWVQTWNKKMDRLDVRWTERQNYQGAQYRQVPYDDYYWQGSRRRADRFRPGPKTGQTLAKIYEKSGFIELDVDNMKGKGPETITFEDVPAGRYQIVVNVWSGKYDIRNADPSIKIMLGLTSFLCKMPPQCAGVGARYWHVADVLVKAPKQVEVKRADGVTVKEYINPITILDRSQQMEPLTSATLPVYPRNLKSSGSRSLPIQEGNLEQWWYAGQAAFGQGDSGLWPSDTALNSVCRGSCNPVWDSGMMTNWRQCLDRDFWTPETAIMKGGQMSVEKLNEKLVPKSETEKMYTWKYRVWMQNSNKMFRWGDMVRIGGYPIGTATINFWQEEDGSPPHVPFLVVYVSPSTRTWQYKTWGKDEGGNDVEVTKTLSFPWKNFEYLRVGFKTVNHREESMAETMQVYIDEVYNPKLDMRVDGYRFKIKMFELENVQNPEFEYEEVQTLDTSLQTKKCVKTCNPSECQRGRDTICWNGGDKPTSTSGRCYSKYTPPGSKWTYCWDQQEVGPAMECCDR